LFAAFFPILKIYEKLKSQKQMDNVRDNLRKTFQLVTEFDHTKFPEHVALPEIVNTVIGFNFLCPGRQHPNFSHIVHVLEGCGRDNARFCATIFPISFPRSTALIFNNGGIILQGQTLQHCLLSMQFLEDTLRRIWEEKHLWNYNVHRDVQSVILINTVSKLQLFEERQLNTRMMLESYPNTIKPIRGSLTLYQKLERQKTKKKANITYSKSGITLAGLSNMDDLLCLSIFVQAVATPFYEEVPKTPKDS
jgi:TATA-box binding protein (TBP) (component of TFIID and TFIIIB)